MSNVLLRDPSERDKGAERLLRSGVPSAKFLPRSGVRKKKTAPLTPDEMSTEQYRVLRSAGAASGQVKNHP